MNDQRVDQEVGIVGPDKSTGQQQRWTGPDQTESGHQVDHIVNRMRDTSRELEQRIRDTGLRMRLLMQQMHQTADQIRDSLHTLSD